jgi:hypothetical protein
MRLKVKSSLSVSKKRVKKGHVRGLLLDILKEKGCIVYRNALIQELANRLAQLYGEERARKKAQICLRDAERDGAVWIEGDKVILPSCIHEKEVVKGLGILVHTLQLAIGTPIGSLENCLEYLAKQGFNIRTVEEVKDLLRHALEHLATWRGDVRKLLEHTYALWDALKRLDPSSPWFEKDQDKARKLEEYVNVYRGSDKELVMLVTRLEYEVREWGKNIGGYCRKCVELGLCSKDVVTNEITNLVDNFVEVLLEKACRYEIK